MTVTIVIQRDENGAPATRELYGKGARYVIQDSNLNVFDSGGDLLGTYGSGNWLSAHIEGSVEVQAPSSDDDSSDDE